MGTSTEVGDQTLSPDFGIDADAEDWMRVTESILPPGVYDGFDVVKQGSDAVVKSGVMLIRDAGGRQIRAETSSPITLTPTPTESTILATWQFKEQEEWWVDFQAAENQTNYDVILAEAVFDQNDDLDTVDNSVKTLPEWSVLNSNGDVTGTQILVPDVNT